MRVRLAKKLAKRGNLAADEWLRRRRWRLARPAMREAATMYITGRLHQDAIFPHLMIRKDI